ncbi:uncharacterized protein (DUF305 family) [Nocardioides luteus]|uniref:Lipoprotein n=1 Tax=Nocardioides luteus TaxID=1844 RepID=A0ABQ5SR72_9ACTN|nr:DUF305 domain-containing protein [Nocardioides luteus]MDR7311111.1 uncharacterized protein (DUF305 family) [Nocardioides luteus]GGR62353.1 lipoprotein [Nocardioides luteus]GLJ66657.1 lipoprotein [Nocardioides luteus]
MRTHRSIVRATCAAAGLTVLLTLSACGGEEAEKPQELSETEHNKADVAFATDMIQHHAQAMSMVDMTMDRDLDPEVQGLADGIRAAQSPEIETMSGWLQQWGEEVPSTMRDHVNGGHEGHGDDESSMSDAMKDMDDMPGMMSAEDMEALEKASDAEFEDMWLEMMVEHHQGAIEMSETEQDSGRFKPAVDLAGTVIETQSDEIDTMEKLLG